MIPPYKIRPSTAADMTQVYDMIKELAVFELMPDGPSISAEVLQKDGFQIDNPLFKCLVVDSGTDLVGYALYYFTYSTWKGRSMFLEDFYVKPSLRKNGIGTSLFKAVAKEAVQSGSARLDFHVLAWNPAQTLYAKLGAENLTKSEQWNCFRIQGANLEKLCEN